MTRTNHQERDLCIAFSLIPFLQPIRLRRLYERFESLSEIKGASASSLAALLNLPEEKARLVRNPLQLPELRRRVAELRGESITLVDGSYPPALREIGDHPPALFFRGSFEQTLGPAIAVVGSRDASRYAIAVAEKLTADLVHAGITIVSGLARGVDAAAHRTAIATGGKTIAVLGAGLDSSYPLHNRSLRKEIERAGCVISEFPPGMPPRAHHFPIRNRIIAGLSCGTLVVEASDRSGSLITARLAAEQGREVFAVPGSIFLNGSVGPHRLVQYGAKLVHDVDDILEEIGVALSQVAQKPEVLMSEELRPLLAILSYDEPAHVDAVATRLGEHVTIVMERLLTLELEGVVKGLPGGHYIRAPDH